MSKVSPLELNTELVGSSSSYADPPSSASESGRGDNSCSICWLSAPELSTTLRVTKCGHMFCDGCLGSYALKRPPGAVPCPLCRLPLPPDDFPSSMVVKVVKTTDTPPNVGLTLITDPDVHARIVLVATGSPSSAAGLRQGMWLISVDGVGVRDADQALECLENATGVDGMVAVRIGGVVPSESDVAFATAALHDDAALRGFRRDAYTPPRDHECGCCIAFCCCCSVFAQLWQRAFRRSRVHCVMVAAVLWALFLFSLVLDLLSDPLATEVLPMITANVADNSTGGGGPFSGLLNPTSFRGVLARYFSPGDLNLDDGIDTVRELSWAFSWLVACPAVLVCWLIGSGLLKGARDRLEQEEPHLWQAATRGLESNDAMRNGWFGPFCSCWCLASRMLDAIVVRPGDNFALRDRYSALMLLPTVAGDVVPAAAALAAAALPVAAPAAAPAVAPAAVPAAAFAVAPSPETAIPAADPPSPPPSAPHMDPGQGVTALARASANSPAVVVAAAPAALSAHSPTQLRVRDTWSLAESWFSPGGTAHTATRPEGLDA